MVRCRSAQLVVVVKCHILSWPDRLIGALLLFTIGGGGCGGGGCGWSLSKRKYQCSLSLYTAGDEHAGLGIVNSLASFNFQNKFNVLQFYLPVYVFLLKVISCSNFRVCAILSLVYTSALRLRRGSSSEPPP